MAETNGAGLTGPTCIPGATGPTGPVVEDGIWFPVAPGITTLSPAPEVSTNPDPVPANSRPVCEDFDPANLPPTFWDVDLPFDTPAVPAEESVVESLVPFAKLDIEQLFVSRTTAQVTRGVVNIPQQESAVLVVRTRLLAFRDEVRNVVLPTRTKLIIDRGAVAIREDLTECFTITGLRVVPFVVESA